MDLSVSVVNQILRVYQTQERIGDLNRLSPTKTVQIQQDRVSLSSKAFQLLQESESGSQAESDSPESNMSES